MLSQGGHVAERDLPHVLARIQVDRGERRVRRFVDRNTVFDLNRGKPGAGVIGVGGPGFRLSDFEHERPVGRLDVEDGRLGVERVAAPHTPGMSSVPSSDGGVKMSPSLKSLTASSALALIAGVKSTRSSSVKPCRPNGGGLVGTG